MLNKYFTDFPSGVPRLLGGPEDTKFNFLWDIFGTSFIETPPHEPLHELLVETNSVGVEKCVPTIENTMES